MSGTPGRPVSLRRDLALRLSLTLLAAWMVALAGAGLVLKARTDRIFDGSLRETAERLLPLAIMEIEADRYRRDHGGKDHDDDDDDDDRGPRVVRKTGHPETHDEYLTYLLRNAAGTIVVQSHDADPSVFPRQAGQGISSAAGHRIYTRTDDAGRFTIQAAEPLSVRRSALVSTLGLMLLPLAVLIPIVLFGISFLVRRGLVSVDELSSILRRRGAQDLSPLPDMALPFELAPIRDAANRLMARVFHALEAERSFASNAAHELRTPIAATLAHTQRLVAEAPQGPVRDRALRVEAELKRMARLAEKLLQLARAEGGGVVAEHPQDMVPILAALIDDLSREPPQGRIQLSLPETPVLSRVDPDAFGVLARNLVENALLHGTGDMPVTVTLTPAGTLGVTNDSAPVPPDTLGRLTKRFERGGSRATGSGLGLTIASSIAAAINRKLRLVSPVPGQNRGFRVEVDIGFAGD